MSLSLTEIAPTLSRRTPFWRHSPLSQMATLRGHGWREHECVTMRPSRGPPIAYKREERKNDVKKAQQGL